MFRKALNNQEKKLEHAVYGRIIRRVLFIVREMEKSIWNSKAENVKGK